jgi:hypothetical protein
MVPSVQMMYYAASIYSPELASNLDTVCQPEPTDSVNSNHLVDGLLVLIVFMMIHSVIDPMTICNLRAICS